MGKPIKVLIAEDSEDDALLVVEELKRGGYEVTFERVETEAGMKAALDKGKWDVIISDYSMPDFNAPKALVMAQEKDINTPFIVVSGTIGEDVAVDMMRKGAHDYLMKDNLKRLIVGVEREVRDAEHRRKRKEAERALNVFRRAIESSTDAVGMSTPEGKHYYHNRAFGKLFGDIGEDPVKEVYVDKDAGREVFDTIRAGREWSGELKMYGKNKEILDISLRAYPIKNDSGEIIDLIGVHTDVTEHRKSEDRIKHLNRVLLAIRGINQLITREKDPEKLVAGAVRHLVETGGYENAWIALFGEKGGLKSFAGEKVEKDFPGIKKTLEEGGRVKCQEMALEKKGTVEIEDPLKTCSGCPMFGEYSGKMAFCAPIADDGRTFGTVTVSLPKEVASIREEQDLFRELVGDLSYSFSAIETEEAGKKMKEEREKHLHELEVFYESAMGREDRILELKKEVDELKKRLGEEA